MDKDYTLEGYAECLVWETTVLFNDHWNSSETRSNLIMSQTTSNYQIVLDAESLLSCSSAGKVWCVTSALRNESRSGISSEIEHRNMRIIHPHITNSQLQQK